MLHRDQARAGRRIPHPRTSWSSRRSSAARPATSATTCARAPSTTAGVTANGIELPQPGAAEEHEVESRAQSVPRQRLSAGGVAAVAVFSSGSGPGAASARATRSRPRCAAGRRNLWYSPIVSPAAPDHAVGGFRPARASREWRGDDRHIRHRPVELDEGAAWYRQTLPGAGWHTTALPHHCAVSRVAERVVGSWPSTIPCARLAVARLRVKSSQSTVVDAGDERFLRLAPPNRSTALSERRRPPVRGRRSRRCARTGCRRATAVMARRHGPRATGSKAPSREAFGRRGRDIREAARRRARRDHRDKPATTTVRQERPHPSNRAGRARRSAAASRSRRRHGRSTTSSPPRQCRRSPPRSPAIAHGSGTAGRIAVRRAGRCGMSTTG